MALRQAQLVQPGREATPQSGSEGARRPLGVDFTSLMHKVSQQSVGDPDQAQPAKPRRDYETAFGLLDQASTALDTLLNRCQQLEMRVVEVSERAKAEAEAAEDVAAQWQKLAGAMKAQVDEYERRLAAMKQRAETAEAKAEAIQSRVSVAEQAASEKEDLSTRFHDKVVAAFGIGSRAHGVLEAVAKGSVPESGPNQALG